MASLVTLPEARAMAHMGPCEVHDFARERRHEYESHNDDAITTSDVFHAALKLLDAALTKADAQRKPSLTVRPDDTVVI